MTDGFTYLGKPPIQDFVQIGPATSPGKCSIVKAGTPRTWNVQQGAYQSGASVLYVGDGLSKFDIIITLWEDEHFVEWIPFSKVLVKAPKGTKPLALPIKHPILTFPPLAITTIVIEDVSQPVLSEWGDWDVTIACLEYRKALPILGGTPLKIPPVAVTPPVAVDVADAVIDKLSQQFLGLAGK